MIKAMIAFIDVWEGVDYKDWCLQSLLGYTTFSVLLNVLNQHMLMSFLIACITAFSVGIFGQIGQKIIFPIIHKKYESWKKKIK